MSEYIASIALVTLAGGVLRLLILRSDYRQYPTYPHGYITHMSLGFIAAGLGGVAVPALIEEEFVAVTFLALAAQQFREIRSIERESLAKLDQTELVPRGEHFIEGIARAFEARNYLIIASTVVLSIGDIFLLRGQAWWLRLAALAAGVAGLYLALRPFMEGTRVGHLARIRQGEVRFDGVNLFVDDIHFMNIGLEEARDVYRKRGHGLVLDPVNIDAASTLANLGQRQAIVHVCSKLLGIYRDVDTQEFTPLVRQDLETGRLAVLIVPATRSIEAFIDAVKKIPVLEGSVSRPSVSLAGRERDDYER